jgi:hypothetical protein
VVALVLASALAWRAEPRLVETWMFVAAAAAVCVLVVFPANVWLLDHDEFRALPWIVMGVLAGLAPAVLCVLSATLGLWWRGGWTDVRWVLAHGAPVPGLGTFAWHRFMNFVAQSVVVGVVTATAQWAMARRRT